MSPPGWQAHRLGGMFHTDLLEVLGVRSAKREEENGLGLVEMQAPRAPLPLNPSGRKGPKKGITQGIQHADNARRVGR